MKYVVPLIIFVFFIQAKPATADSCVILNAGIVHNTCTVCKTISLREMRPHDDRAAGLFTGINHALRLQPGEKSTLPAGTSLWSINGLAACT